MADQGDESLYPIAVLIDELRNEDVQVTELKHVISYYNRKLIVCAYLFSHDRR